MTFFCAAIRRYSVSLLSFLVLDFANVSFEISIQSFFLLFLFCIFNYIAAAAAAAAAAAIIVVPVEFLT